MRIRSYNLNTVDGMKCRIDITAKIDRAAWVSRQAFMANVDPDDLECRKSLEIGDWYHPDWFGHDTRGNLYFTPPAFEFRDGYLCAINGRHRAVLLFRHMEAIPMLLVMPDRWPTEKLAEIILSEIEEGETVALPDLPMNTAI